MKLYEIDKMDLHRRAERDAIAAGLYIVRDDEFIKKAFNFGNGSRKDMNRYMQDNARFCVWIDAETMKKVSHI